MSTDSDQLTCTHGCQAAPVQSGLCLMHLDLEQPERVEELLRHLGPDATVDLRGVLVSGTLLAKVLEPGRVLGELNLANSQSLGVDGYFGHATVRRLVLDGAQFSHHVEIEVLAERISCVRTRFEQGVTLRVSGAAIDATSTVFGATSSITTSLAFSTVMQPRLVSLRGTDVSNLVLVDVDLSWCLFAGAHRLDLLRLEDRCVFAYPPGSVRWSRRQLLAEERLVRGWEDKHPFVADALPIRWERLAALYRSLRKAFEDNKNEAGAGDFYYGEMEARRHSSLTPRAERLILTAYWLLSGYGQRAGRAVATLVVLVAIVCLLLFTVGLPGQVVWTWGRVDQALRIGMGAVVFREAGQTLTSAGSWTVMVARFAGPVLLALAVLAIRARVKR